MGCPPLISINGCTQDAEKIRRGFFSYQSTLKEAVDQAPGARFLDSARYLCADHECDMTREGQLLYRDNNHLPRQGSRYVTNRLIENYAKFARDLGREK